MPNTYILESKGSEDLDQCDIFDQIHFSGVGEDLIGIAVTATCDYAQNKADHNLFCAVLPFNNLFYKVIEKELSLSKEQFLAEIAKGKKKEIIDRIKKLLNNQYPRYHWIGNLPGKDGFWYVDYQLVQSLNQNYNDQLLLKKFAKVQSPLKESIYVRFANYVGRVGLVGEHDARETLANEIFDYYKKNP